MDSKQASITALSGALLQIAKQEISIKCKYLNLCPHGREIYGVKLKEIIWQGRNQCMHFDDSRGLHKPTNDCFDQLNSHLPTPMKYTTENCAKQVLDILKWNDYTSYEVDMTSIS